jgi:hypothetical protein
MDNSNNTTTNNSDNLNSFMDVNSILNNLLVSSNNFLRENTRQGGLLMPRLNPLLMPVRPQSLVYYLNDNHNYQPTMEDVLHESFNDKANFKDIVSEEGLSQIEDITYHTDNSGEYEYTSCPITTDEFEDGEILKKIGCGHIFSSDAILVWFKESNKCPLCRYELPSKEVKIENEETDIDSNSDSQSDTQTDSDDELDTQELANNRAIRSLARMFNTYRSPYSMLNNRRVIPHSYIESFVNNTIIRDEDEMLQEALMNSLQDMNTNNETSSPTPPQLSESDLSGN